MNPLSLRALQQKMAQAITQADLDLEDLKQLGVLDQPPIDAVTRLEIYRTAYQIRMTESLREDFPRTEEVLGEEQFDTMVQHYLLSFPSTSWTLAELGKNLPTFILESIWRTKFKFLGDLARLEWLMFACEHAPKTPAFDFKILSTLNPIELQQFTLHMSPSASTFVSEFELHGDYIKRKTYYLIFRTKNDLVEFEALEAKHYKFLSAISKGVSIQNLVDYAFDLAPDEVSQMFTRWASQGILTHMEPPKNSPGQPY